MRQTPKIGLKVKRVIKAPPARVFRAWTEPDLLKKWFVLGTGSTTPTAEVDLRVGGRWVLEFQPPGNGDLLSVGGTYQEIIPPSKLVFTWRWAGTGSEVPDSVVTIECLPHPNGTKMLLRHDRFIDEAAKTQHEGGWINITASLVAHFE